MEEKYKPLRSKLQSIPAKQGEFVSLCQLAERYKIFIQMFGEPRVKQNEPLEDHTYFKIGGPADLFFTAQSVVELKKAIQICKEMSIPFIVLGGGSNVLISDRGFRGVVIKNRSNGIKMSGYKGQFVHGERSLSNVFLEADSGVPLNQLIRYSIDQGLAGLEIFLGTPGSVGGAIYNNSHFDNQFIGDRLHSAKVLKKGEIVDVGREHFRFSYDYSTLQKSKEILLSATFLLHSGKKEELWRIGTESVNKRKETQPLDFPSSGCVFKNPKDIQAGYLIEKCNLKGMTVGGAKISEKHGNFIINTGGAKASDIFSLIKLVKEKVKENYGYLLETEVFLIGDFEEDK